MFRMFKSVLAKEGIRGLFVGFVPSMLGGYPAHVVHYFCFEFVRTNLDTLVFHKLHLGEKSLTLDVAISACSGLAAEACSALTWLPADIVSQRLQVRSLPKFRKFSGPLEVVMNISKVEGFRGFFRGYWISLAMYATASSMWWASYEFTKEHCHRYTDQVPDWSIHLMAGGLSGAVSSVFLNPLEVARTRLQVIVATSDSLKVIKRGYWPMFFDIYRFEGLWAYWRGLLPRFLVVVPGSAIAIVSYEFAKRASLNSKKTESVV